MFVSLARLCVVYVVKEVASFPGARSINGRGTLKKRAFELQTSRMTQKGCKTTNNCCI